MTIQRAAFWSLSAATATNYAIMIFWALPKISDDAAGALPFDLRWLGYNAAEARALLQALSAEGTHFYLTVQYPLDLAFPALLAATLFFAIRELAPFAPNALALIALPGALFDYLENEAVSSLLRQGAATATDDLIAQASLWTVLKSASVATALVLVVCLAAARWSGILTTARVGRTEQAP